jgi:uncharacterized membrane protein YkvA (DUF1232 family)
MAAGTRALKYILVGVLYLLMPLDILPDFLPPLLGRLDDALVIGYLIWRYRKIQRQMASYYQTAENVFSSFRSTGEGSSDSKSSTECGAAGESPQKKRTPYEVLELSPGASKKEVEQAYKKLVAQYHPDKVDHLGQEFQELAHEKMLEIQEAYEVLRRNR